MNFQKWGGVSGLMVAVTFIIGFIFYFTILSKANYGSMDIELVRNVVFLVNNVQLMHLFYLVIYVIFGGFLVVLVLALNERLHTLSPDLVKVATAFGLIWACLVIASGMVANIGSEVVVNLYSKNHEQAVATWIALQFVVNGLGGGNEIIGGVWILLLSIASFRQHGLSKPLNCLGLAVGASGLITTIPGLGMLGAIFGIGCIVWFIWLGFLMLRTPAN